MRRVKATEIRPFRKVAPGSFVPPAFPNVARLFAVLSRLTAFREERTSSNSSRENHLLQPKRRSRAALIDAAGRSFLDDRVELSDGSLIISSLLQLQTAIIMTRRTVMLVDSSHQRPPSSNRTNSPELLLDTLKSFDPVTLPEFISELHNLRRSVF